MARQLAIAALFLVVAALGFVATRPERRISGRMPFDGRRMVHGGFEVRIDP